MYKRSPIHLPYHNELREIYRYLRPGSTVLFIPTDLLDEVSQLMNIKRCFKIEDSGNKDIAALFSESRDYQLYQRKNMGEVIVDLKNVGIPFTMVSSSQPNYVIARYTPSGSYHLRDLGHDEVSVEPEHVIAMLQSSESYFGNKQIMIEGLRQKLGKYMDPPLDAVQVEKFKQHKLRTMIKPELIWANTNHEF